ncbi:MAG TPA: PilZ domain-containing protein [Gemmataceae bacterium]|nr:PilZ domain-containing protein [Gemmataceae bacterium]
MLKLGRKIIRKFTAPAHDRRVDPRHATDIRTICRPVSEDYHIAIQIRDVSQGGLKFLAAKALRQGTMVRIDLPNLSGPTTTVLACVTHVHEISPVEWEAGCNFSLELSDDEMRAFGAAKLESGADDARAWVRHPARGIVEFRVLPGHDGPARTAQLVDLSPAGVGLIVDEKLEAGAAITVSMKRLDDKPDRPFLACVVYQTERPDGKWAVGCNFLHRLTESDLDELLWASSF